MTPKRVLALDGVRGVAILAVLFHHYLQVGAGQTPVDLALASATAYGANGVTLFFVLSGFLITGILLDAKEHRAYFRNFYARRVLRIFPLYYAVLLGVLVVFPRVPLLHEALSRGGDVGSDAPWYWLYLANFAIASHTSWQQMTLDLTWSLSIEEQFYLVWPLVVLLCSARRLMYVCGALLATSLAWWAALAIVQPQGMVSVLTPGHVGTLAAGAFIALLVRDAELRNGLRRRAPLVLAWSGCMVLLAAAPAQVLGNDVFFFQPLLAVCFASLIGVIVTSPTGWITHLFESRLLQAFGRYSYALYLLHRFVQAIIEHLVYAPEHFARLFGSPIPGQVLFLIIGICGSFVAAWLSWHLLEKHCLALKRYFEVRPAPALRPAADVPADGAVVLSTAQ